MPTTELLSLLALAALVWFWLDALRAREAGMAAARAACAAAGLQLLDDTVAASSLRLDRDEQGRLQIRRVFAFEYSEDGMSRQSGSVTVLGRRVVMTSIRPRVLDVVR